MGFRVFGATNAPGTCRWCGKKLRPYKYFGKPWATGKKPLGDYGDGAFCGLRCGYQYARAMVDRGNILVSNKGKAS